MPAEIFPDEGLDLALAWTLGLATPPTTLYLGYFTSQTGTTVPARTAVLATATGVTEATGTGYARTAIPNTDWGAVATNGSGRKRTAAQKVAPTVGAGGWGTLNGFFLADALTAGKAVYYANFDDDTPIPTLVNDVVKVTPYIQANG